MEYVRLSKSPGFKYACNSHLYSQYSKKEGVMYLKCDTADCKETVKIYQGLLVQYMQIPRRPIYCQNPLLAHSITCKFIQPPSVDTFKEPAARNVWPEPPLYGLEGLESDSLDENHSSFLRHC